MIDEKIVTFLREHHLLTLATCKENVPYCANCFYAFIEESFRFIIASDESTKHMQFAKENPNISGTIALETKEIGKIQGLQFCGIMEKATMGEKAHYLKTYPYAIALNPTLWSLHVKYIKFTDNRLGFGKKLEYNLEDF